MMKSKQVVLDWSRSAGLLCLVVGGVCLVAVPPSIGGVNEFARPAEVNASMLVAEDPGWLPGETPVPGEFANAVVDNLGAQRIHYVDALGVKRTSVLVYMDPSIAKRAMQRANVRAFAAKKGGIVRYEYGATMPGVLNLRDIPESAVAALAKMPGVVKVEKDEYHPNVVRLTKSTPLIRGLQSQITGAGLSADGAGVRVCVCDTGIDMDHVMYASRIDAAASWDFANNDSNPDDDHGHGSHVSGIAVGGTGLNIDLGCGTVPFQGVAPAATLIGAKVLNSAGGGTDSDIIAGIDHCADQTASGGRADVINLSIGTGNFSGTCTHSWAVAANNAVANGVVVVAASGNECNTNSMGSPACGVDVIAVGATYKDAYPNCEDTTSSFNWCGSPQTGIGVDDIVDFSNQSDFLDVAAPGSVIWSASNSAGGGSVTGMSGTSMSSPHVAGLAALIIGVDPTLTPAEVRQVIRDGAIDMGPAGFDRAYGYGRIDVIGSLQLLTPCTGDPDCDDGLWCNGSETCSAGSCFASSDPCPGQSCDEATNTCVATPTLQFEWNMNTNPGWTAQGQWAWGQPTGGGGQHGGPDPTSGATGTNVFGYNLSGDYPNNLAETHLTTNAIDCSNLAEVSVNFQRWLGVETPTFDHAYFRISTNGSTWTTLWSNGAEVADTIWKLQTFDISAIADGQPTVFLRWTMGTTDSSWQYCGWNVDDVQIWGRDTAGGCTTDGECDDSLFCNGTEVCNAGTCGAGTPPNCNDGVGCTDDSCNEGTNSCDNVANDGNCDDGLFCNGSETCDAVNDCQAGTTVNCNDGVGCTDDSCNEGTNSCDNLANNANCDNGIFCDGTETCDAVNDCQAGTTVNCNDGVGCTDDSCNEGTNSCDNVANNGNCDDGLFCNGSETCDAVNDCQAGTTVNCSDGVGCTDDSCNEGTNSCDNVANDGNCDDGLFCNGSESCDAVNDCQAGTTVNCNDGVGCTDDSCNEGTNSCDNLANNANCDNGIFCDGAETCDAVNDCLAGSAVNCNDGVGCTDDSCNEGTNSCDNVANNGNCDDGLFCNGSETCDAVNDCQVGTAVNCNDGVGCTDDSCNEATNSCDNVANNANCPDDGLFCNGTESCDAINDCVSSGDPCVGQACDEGTASCVNCLINADCDDGLFCNGTETCSAGACQSGTAINCNDGVGCTDDSCNESTASCDNVANNTSCDDGLFCNGTETCDVVNDCQAGAAVNCDDGVACTDDSCNEGTNSCDNVANNANCDDGLFCSGIETCDAVNDCQAGSDPCPGQLCDEGNGTCNDCLIDADCDDGLFCNGAEICSAGVCQSGLAVNCNDGVGCTDDSCNEGTNSCDNIVNDANCDNGLFCDGTETCDAAFDCQAGSAVNCNDGVGCTDDSCNEGTNSCDNVANNANCPDDGLFCNGTESCDAINDCVSSGDPCGAGTACNETTDTCDSTGPPPGEGFILSRNADFSTDDRSFFVNETLYMMLWTDQVDFNDINRERWELKDINKNKVRLPLTNHFDGTWTAAYDLSLLPTNATDWTWKGEAKDNAGNSFKPTDFITVLDAPACSIDLDCDDGDACTTDVCSGGSCSNTPIDCNDGNACTTDSCSGGVCFNDPISCDDGDACTTDTCDPGAGCSNTPINCDDGDPCTSDSCSSGVCFNDPLPTCCGDGFCDAGEDSCNCPADCGAPPASETNCTDGIDEDCDGSTDCADTDCSGDPACSTPTGEGYILSLNPDFSTDDRVYTRTDIIYMKVWSDQVDFNNMNRERWELKDPAKNKVRQPMTNHFDGTWTASFDLSGLPSNDTDWAWKGDIKDNAGIAFKPTDAITVLP